MYTSIDRYFKELLERKADERVVHYPGMKSFNDVFYILSLYATLVLFVLPKITKNRKPLSLQKPIIFYNVFQVIANTYIVYQCIYIFYSDTNYSYFKGNAVDKSNNPLSSLAIQICFLYYVSKLTDLMDTIFFVLRKKYNQVTFLHMYHHISTPLFCWIGIKLAPGGSNLYIIMLNSFVHIIMYAYYAIAAMGPEYKRYIWWKKYLTSLQLVQFVLLFVHFIILLCSPAKFPKEVSILFTANILTNFVLFTFFYKREYQKKTKMGAN